MKHINAEYEITEDNGARFLVMQITDKTWDSNIQIQLFSEAAESLVWYSYENICFDLSSLSLITSSILGTCINIISTAKGNGKNIKFRINSETVEPFRCASIDKLVQVEEVKLKK